MLMAIDGLPDSWETFTQGISARDQLPDFNRLKNDCLQEETRKLKKGGKPKVEDEELHILNVNSYKGKKKLFKKKKGNQNNGKSKKDLSKIKCSKCEKFGHYRSNCPKNSKQQANCTNVIREEDTYDLENFVLYSSLSNEISNKAWVIDSGSSRHNGIQKNSRFFIRES